VLEVSQRVPVWLFLAADDPIVGAHEWIFLQQKPE
jgi:hypothetical protein